MILLYMNIVITGTSRGIGHALAERYLEAGDTVYGSARSSDPEGHRTLSERYPNNFFPTVLDITNDSSVALAKTFIESHCDSIDVLVNNAGIYPDHNLYPFDKSNLAALSESFECNAVGSMRFSMAMYSLLKRADDPKICNISSMIGSIAFHKTEYEYSYTTSKAALNMITRLMQLQLRKDGISVLAMSPGWVQTDMGGPKAPLTPLQSSKRIYEQITAWDNNDHPFIAQTGKAIDW